MGKVGASMSSVQRYISNPAITKAYGARQAVEFGHFLGLQSVIVEGDALEIVSALGCPRDGDGRYGNLLEDARRLQVDFRVWDIRHVRQDGNKVAHTLAKFAVSQQQNHVFGSSLTRHVYSN
jgi:hypothetical protein